MEIKELNDSISYMLVEMANNLVGGGMTSSGYPTLDFVIPLGTSESFYRGDYKEKDLIEDWTELVVSYINVCRRLYPKNGGFKICWGHRPIITCLDGENYVLFSRFNIVPIEGHRISKRAFVCPYCRKIVESSLSLVSELY